MKPLRERNKVWEGESPKTGWCGLEDVRECVEQLKRECIKEPLFGGSAGVSRKKLMELIDNWPTIRAFINVRIARSLFIKGLIFKTKYT